MNIIINNSIETPIYIQLKEQIKKAIIKNEIISGDKLPSIRVLAKDLGISVITTKTAYEQLEKEGYVETIPAKGVYVSKKSNNLLKEEQYQKLENILFEATKIASVNGFSKTKVKQLIDLLWEDEDE